MNKYIQLIYIMSLLNVVSLFPRSKCPAV